MLDLAGDSPDQVLNSVWLIARWLKIGDKCESIHNMTLYSLSLRGSTGNLVLTAALKIGRITYPRRISTFALMYNRSRKYVSLRCQSVGHTVEAYRCWCAAWTSNPVIAANPRDGGFDSHTLPPPFLSELERQEGSVRLLPLVRQCAYLVPNFL